MRKKPNGRDDDGLMLGCRAMMEGKGHSWGLLFIERVVRVLSTIYSATLYMDMWCMDGWLAVFELKAERIVYVCQIRFLEQSLCVIFMLGNLGTLCRENEQVVISDKQIYFKLLYY